MRRRDSTATPIPVSHAPISDATRVVREREPLVRSVAKAARAFVAQHFGVEHRDDDAER